MTGAILKHLIESTVFAALTAFLLFTLRVRKPGVRHTAWLLAAVKFLLPISLLVSLGSALCPLAPQTIPVAWSGSAALLARVSAVPVLAPVSKPPVEAALLCVWLAGAILAVGVWMRRLGRHLKTAPAPVAESARLHRLALRTGVRQTVTLRHSPDLASPGLTGIWRPVICLPRTLAGELEPSEFEAVILHELAHVRRWDNLCGAAVHAIACLFWFHPLLWWIERKAAFEAERACDDLVVGWGAPPEKYADAILRVCSLQVTAPLAGVSGMGSYLNDRMEWILSGRIGQRGGRFGSVAVAILAGLMTLAPFAAGFLARPALATSSATPVAASLVQNPEPIAPAKARQRPRPKPAPAGAAVAVQATEAEPIRCAYMSVWYPEGTVGRMGSDRMCVASEDGSPRWEPVETAGRPQVGETVDLWAVRLEPKGAEVCKVRGSKSESACSCDSGPIPLGGTVTSDRGERLVCEKWSTRKTAEWRPVVSGKDNQ